MSGRKSIAECDVCADIADTAFESGPGALPDVAVRFLEHVFREHPEEVLGVLAEKYIPIFIAKRGMR